MFTRSDEPQKSTPYQGAMNAKDIAKFCIEQLSAFVKARQGDKPSGSASQSSGSSSGSSSKGGSKSESRSQSSSSSSQSSKASSAVVELTDKAF